MQKHWRKFLSVLSRDGNIESSRRIAGISRKALAHAKANHAHLARRIDEAQEAGKAYRAQHKARKVGRPPVAMTPTDKARALAVYAESGSLYEVSEVIHVSIHGLYKAMRGDAAFNAAMSEAKATADFIASEAGHWRKRKAAALEAIANGATIDEASRNSKVNAAVLLLLEVPRPAPRANNRFIPDKRKRHARHIVAAPIVRRDASEAETAGQGGELRRAESILTPEQRAFIAPILDDGASLAKAAELAGMTENQVNAWAANNAYLRFIFDDCGNEK